LTAEYFKKYISIFYLWGTPTVILTKFSAASLFISKVKFTLSVQKHSETNGTVSVFISLFLSLFSGIAHSAYDMHEFAACLHKAYNDCKVVEILNKFTNFVDTVKPLLNTASTTEGADHFSEFRCACHHDEGHFIPSQL
jgi:hypothetical protein